MTASDQRIAGLEQQIADLAARFAEFERDAWWLKELEETQAARAGYPAGRRAVRKAPRHLHAVDGGQP